MLRNVGNLKCHYSVLYLYISEQSSEEQTHLGLEEKMCSHSGENYVTRFFITLIAYLIFLRQKGAMDAICRLYDETEDYMNKFSRKILREDTNSES